MSRVFALSGLLLLFTTAAPALEGAQQPADEPAAAEEVSLEDAPLAPLQAELLELAYQTASAMPAYPHVKDRSRAQEQVVTLCLELDQPARALRLLEGIENWRRGACFADLALYCVRSGRTEPVQGFLERALEVARTDEQAQLQQWRGDRIRAKVAAVYAWLGEDDEASRHGEGLADSELGRVGAARAMTAGPEALDEQSRALEAVLAAGSLDQVRGALGTWTLLHGRFYGDEERRARIEDAVRSGSRKVPVLVSLELYTELVEHALDHGDRDHALELVEEIEALFESARWTRETELPVLARLGALRFRAGDLQGGRARVGQALASYGQNREAILNFRRGGILRAIGEAYVTLGAPQDALATYAKAVEEGVVNPNSRVRALDLSATCLSMARIGFQPSPELWMRMNAIFEEQLGDPW